MPEETTTPTTPAAPTPPATPDPGQTPAQAQINESTGRQDVTADEFLTPDEQAAQDAAAKGEETTTPPVTSTTSTVEDVLAKKPEERDDNDKKVLSEATLTDEQKQQLASETTPPTPPATEKLFAGKYKTLEELKAAFIELGGDPTRYSTPEALAEAYEVRQSEYSRVNHEQANLDKLNQNIEKGGEKPVIDQDGVDKLLTQLDWTKITDARDMAAQLLPIIFNNLPKLLPQAQPMNEKDMVEKLAPMIAARETKLKELRDIETNVPRLKTDKTFRRAFAGYIRGQKDDGTFKGLDSAMKDFLGLSQSIVEELGKTKTETTQDKGSAAPAPDGGQGAPGGETKTDEADDIISAHADYMGKYNFI